MTPRLARLLHRLHPRCALRRAKVARGVRYCPRHDNERAQHEEMSR